MKMFHYAWLRFVSFCLLLCIRDGTEMFHSIIEGVMITIVFPFALVDLRS